MSSTSIQSNYRGPSETQVQHLHPQMSIHMTFADALSGIVSHFYIDPTRFQAGFLTIQLSHSLAGLASLRGEQHILHVFVIDVI